MSTFPDQGYHDGVSGDYEIIKYVSTQPDPPAPHFGPGQPESGITPIDTTGWLEVIPGVFALPIPTPVIIDHAQLSILLQFRKGVGPLNTNPDPPVPVITPVLHLAPIKDAQSTEWNGTWGDTPNDQFARVLVRIRPSALSLSTQSAPFPAPRTAAPSTFGSIAIFAGITVDIDDRIAYLQLHNDHLTSAPAIVGSYSGDIWIFPWIFPGTMSFHRSLPSASSPSTVTRSPVLGNSTGGLTPLTVPSSALGATIVVTDNVSLQLWGDYDDHNHLVWHRVRYLRTDKGGAVVADAMLVRSAPPPR